MAAVIETHAAIVFFAGDRAYKMKKPVDLGFLDFRRRTDREAVRHREVELNRRLAADVHLGVADIYGLEFARAGRRVRRCVRLRLTPSRSPPAGQRTVA